MTSNINTSGIDITFPIAGKNNNSVGFRTNWAQISSNLGVAHDEITALQQEVGSVTTNLTLTLAGDVTSPITVLPGGVTMTTSLKSRGIGVQSFDSTIQDFSFTVNDAGVVTQLAVATSDITKATQSPITVTTNSTLNGTGVTQLSLPEFTISKNGKIVASDNKIITFGFAGLPLSKGSTIVGNMNNVSDIVTPTTDKQVLMYKGGITSYQTLSITDFADIDFSGATSGQVLTYNGTKWIPENPSGGSGFNPNNIGKQTSVTSAMGFIMIESDSSGNSILEQVDNPTMLTYLKENVGFKLVNDLSPQLGGTLDLNGNSIICENDSGITIGGALTLNAQTMCNIGVGSSMLSISPSGVMMTTSGISLISGGSSVTMGSSGMSIHSATTINGSFTVNGVKYPSALPTIANAFLTSDLNGNSTWQIPNISSSIGTLVEETSGSKNTKFVVYDPTTSTANIVSPSNLLSVFYGKFYVSENGNDETADGSISAPYKTLSALFSYISSYNGTYNEVDVIIDSGNYTLSNTPTNVNSLALSSFSKVSDPIITSDQNCAIVVNNLSCSGLTFNFYGTFSISYGTFYDCGFTGAHSYNFIGNSNPQSLNFEACWFELTAAGNMKFSNFVSVYIRNSFDLSKISTIYIGTQSATADTTQYEFSNINIGNMYIYSGNAFFHACEFYHNFYSYITNLTNSITISNCNFIGYSNYPGSHSWTCNVSFDPTSVVYFNGNTSVPVNVDLNANQAFNSYMLTPQSPIRYDLTGASNYNYQVIKISSDLIVIKLSSENIANCGGIVNLYLTYVAGTTHTCKFVLYVTDGIPSNCKVNLWNVQPFNNYKSDTSITSVDSNVSDSNFDNVSSYRITVDLNVQGANSFGASVYELGCEYISTPTTSYSVKGVGCWGPISLITR